MYTDHSACLSILNTPKPSGKLARWALTIQEMDLTIRHKPGRLNSNADALSRCPAIESPSQVCVVNTVEEDDLPSVPDLKLIADQQSKDSEMAQMLAYLQDRKLPEEDKLARRIVHESKLFTVINGVLYHENPVRSDQWCVVVPVEYREPLLKEAHQGSFAGHLAEKKTYSRLRTRYWWQKMRDEVSSFCKSCLICASCKGGRKVFKPPLAPIPVGGPFHRVAVDVLQLPHTSNGNCYVVVFMDYLTKWPEAFATPDQKAETIAKLFVEEIVCRHGIPEELLSDRGTNFLSSLIQEVCKLLGVKKLNTSGYHPQNDGLVEKFNSTLIRMITKSCDVRNRDWDVHLPYLLFAYRVAVQESTHESPFFLLYGRDARIPTDSVLAYSRSPYAVDLEDYKEDLLTEMSAAWKLASDNISKAQCAQKRAYDKKSKEVDLRVGDRVMVLMPAEKQGKNWKLSRPFLGPYRVLQITLTNVEVRMVDRPTSESIFVALDRVRKCYPEQSNDTWTGYKHHRKNQPSKKSSKESDAAVRANESPGVVSTEKVDGAISSERRVTRSMTKQRKTD